MVYRCIVRMRCLRLLEKTSILWMRRYWCIVWLWLGGEGMDMRERVWRNWLSLDNCGRVRLLSSLKGFIHLWTSIFRRNILCRLMRLLCRLQGEGILRRGLVILLLMLRRNKNWIINELLNNNNNNNNNRSSNREKIKRKWKIELE
jgi:hypothetical protein